MLVLATVIEIHYVQLIDFYLLMKVCRKTAQSLLLLFNFHTIQVVSKNITAIFPKEVIHIFLN